MFLYLYFSIPSFYSIAAPARPPGTPHTPHTPATPPVRRPPPPQGLALHPPPGHAGHAGRARDAAPSLLPPPPRFWLCTPPRVETLAMSLSIFLDSILLFYSIAAPARPPGTPDTPGPLVAALPAARFGSAPPPRVETLAMFVYFYSSAAPARPPGMLDTPDTLATPPPSLPPPPLPRRKVWLCTAPPPSRRVALLAMFNRNL